MPVIKARRILSLLIVLAACPCFAQARDAAPSGCGGQTLGVFTAGAAIDGRTFRLEDGREVRLAGIEVPAGLAARDNLDKLIAGRRVLLKHDDPGNDRYGRVVAHVFVPADGSESWIEREMAAAGLARAGARIGEPACAAALLAAEQQARKARLGLWGDPAYAIKLADDAAAMLAERGQFILAEGHVLSVRESAGTIYINFGQVWSRSLTVTILKRNERLFVAAGIDPKRLQGRRLRVRGWIEDRGGPRIEAARPEQIEIADQAGQVQ